MQRQETKPRDAESATESAMGDAWVNGLFAFVPSVATVAYLTKNNAAFIKRTNWQSRTAMAIMPPMFVLALTAELKTGHSILEKHKEEKHKKDTVEWADRQLQLAQLKEQTSLGSKPIQHNPFVIRTPMTAPANFDENDKEAQAQEEAQLRELYMQSVNESGVCIVDELKPYHKAANFVAENPFKLLAGLGIPAVFYVFKGKPTGQRKLPLMNQILQTRVIGQFAVLCIFMGIVSFKQFADANGRYISQEAADEKVEEMLQVRKALMQRLRAERKVNEEMKQKMEEAVKEDAALLAEKKRKKRQKKREKQEQEQLARDRLMVEDATATS